MDSSDHLRRVYLYRGIKDVSAPPNFMEEVIYEYVSPWVNGKTRYMHIVTHVYVYVCMYTYIHLYIYVYISVPRYERRVDVTRRHGKVLYIFVYAFDI